MPEATQLVSGSTGLDPRAQGLSCNTTWPAQEGGRDRPWGEGGLGGVTDLYVHGGHSLDTQQADHAGEEAQGS